METNKRIYPELPEKPKIAFDLPKISYKRFDNDIEDIIEELRESKTILLFYRTKSGKSTFCFSDLGENEYKLFINQINRFSPLYDFFKTGIINIDRLRKGSFDEQAFHTEAIKYLRLKTKNL